MKQANTKQKKWLRDIAETINEHGLGLLYPDYEGRTDFQLHHVLGRSAKHNKIEIGHWFVIPVPFELHDVSSNHPCNVTHFKRRFVRRYGPQSQIFLSLVHFVEARFPVPSTEIKMAIMDTNA